MRKSSKPTRTIEIDGQKWSERELAQIIRRKMITGHKEQEKVYKKIQTRS